MKVMCVITSLGAGGAERSLVEMLPGLSARGIEAQIVYLRSGRVGIEGEAQRRGLPLRLLRGSVPSRILGLRRLVSAERPALIHATLFEANLTGGLAAWGTAVPVLISLVNTSYVRARRLDPRINPLRIGAARWADSWVCRRLGSHVHAITEAVKVAAVRDLGIPSERITVVERGRDPGRLGRPTPERRRQARRRLGVGDEEHLIMTIGRQEYAKGQRHLLEAMALLLPGRPSLRLLVAGRSGHMTAELERARSGTALAERVHFVGFRDDVPDLLAASDLFVFPSLWEGLGGSMIEAMALGLPIVASDIPAVREVTEPGRNADLVPPGSAQDLAGAIAALLDDLPRRTAYGARSRQLFEERFTLERSTEGMAALYRRVAEEAGVRAEGRGKVPTAAS